MSIDLNAPEVLEAIQAAVDKATAPLVAKRDELLAEVRGLKKGKTIDPADVEKLENELEAARSDLVKAQKQVKDLTTAAEKSTKDLETERSFNQRLLVDSGLTEALTKAGVTNPVHLKYAKAELAKLVQVTADGDQKVAKVGDKALADYVADWSKGDEGKHFVAAPANSGGGAGGGGGGASTPASLKDAKTPAERKAVIQARLDAAGKE